MGHQHPGGDPDLWIAGAGREERLFPFQVKIGPDVFIQVQEAGLHQAHHSRRGYQFGSGSQAVIAVFVHRASVGSAVAPPVDDFPVLCDHDFTAVGLEGGKPVVHAPVGFRTSVLFRKGGGRKEQGQRQKQGHQSADHRHTPYSSAEAKYRISVISRWPE